MENFTPQLWRRIKSLWGRTSSVECGNTKIPAPVKPALVPEPTPTTQTDTQEESDPLQEKIDAINVKKLENIRVSLLQLADEQQNYQFEISDLRRSYSDQLKENVSIMDTYESRMSKLQEKIYQLSVTEDQEKERLTKLCEEQAIMIGKMNENYKELQTLAVEGLNRISELLLLAEQNFDNVNDEDRISDIAKKITRWKSGMQKKIIHYKKRQQSTKESKIESKKSIQKPLYRNSKVLRQPTLSLRTRNRLLNEEDDSDDSALNELLERSRPESSETLTLSTPYDLKQKFVGEIFRSPLPPKRCHKKSGEVHNVRKQQFFTEIWW